MFDTHVYSRPANSISIDTESICDEIEKISKLNQKQQYLNLLSPEVKQKALITAYKKYITENKRLKTKLKEALSPNPSIDGTCNDCCFMHIVPNDYRILELVSYEDAISGFHNVRIQSGCTNRSVNGFIDRVNTACRLYSNYTKFIKCNRFADKYEVNKIQEEMENNNKSFQEILDIYGISLEEFNKLGKIIEMSEEEE